MYFNYLVKTLILWLKILSNKNCCYNTFNFYALTQSKFSKNILRSFNCTHMHTHTHTFKSNNFFSKFIFNIHFYYVLYILYTNKFLYINNVILNALILIILTKLIWILFFSRKSLSVNNKISLLAIKFYLSYRQSQ